LRRAINYPDGEWRLILPVEYRGDYSKHHGQSNRNDYVLGYGYQFVRLLKNGFHHDNC
jgi:hypothetical protein